MRTLINLFVQVADAPPRDDLLAFRRKDGTVVSCSTAQFAAGVLAVRRYLQQLGLKPGDRAAIWAANCPEWHIADFGCLTAGVVVVPLYATSPMAQVEFILSHSEARAVLFAGDMQSGVLNNLRDKLPDVRGFLALDDRSAPWHARLCDQMAGAPALPDRDALESVRALAQSIDDQSVASIVYTSGTTGQPKGVMLTHANICFNLRQSMQRLQFRSVNRALSVLPLAHVFERILCYGYFASGIAIAYGDPHDLKQLLPLHRPATMGCVPRVLEKILESVRAEIDALPTRRRGPALWMLTSSVQRLMTDVVDISTLLGSTLAQALLFPRVRKKLAGLEFLVCGGAYLDPSVEAFFRAAGFSVLQGYGLTETSPVIALNSFGPQGLGTVGPPLDGVEVRIEESGHILTRGPHVMKGYFKDPDATAESLRDGWLRTGDLGSLDPSGRLIVKGRAKDTVVLSTGKKVSSSHVEQALGRSEVIQSAVVVGNHRKFLSVVIVPHWDKVRQFAAGRNLPLDATSPEIHPEIAAWIAAEIAQCSSELAEHERIKRFCLLPEEALSDPEIVTPTQKLRRNAFEERYRQWIDRMYSDTVPFLIIGGVMSATGAPR